MKTILKKSWKTLSASLGFVSLLAATFGAKANLVHRYSFDDDTASTNAIDSVGGATGNVFPGAFYPGDGTIILDGFSGFVYLPDDLVSNYTSITFEAWTTPSSNPTWARLFDFGTNQGGPGTGGAGGTGGNGVSWIYLCLSDGGGALRGDVNPTGGAVTGPPPAAGVYHHLVFTIDATNKIASLFVDGALAGIQRDFNPTPRTVGHTYNDYIGRSQWPDPYYNGSIDEFRIYDTFITPAQAEANYEAGPGVTNATPGALDSIELVVPGNIILGGFQAPVLRGNYANLTNSVTITAEAGITYSSSDTNVIFVGADGFFHAASVGTATLTAVYQSKTSNVPVTVINPPPVLVHRYSFNEAADATTVEDSVSDADGILVNGGQGTGAVLGGGQLTLDGDLSSGYVELPAGIISILTNATFQAWVTWDGTGGNWQRIFDFGNGNGTGGGLNYIYCTPNADGVQIRTGIKLAGLAEQNASAPVLVSGSKVAVTVSYNASLHVISLYVDGRKVASGVTDRALSSVIDTSNWLGRSEYLADHYFSGSFDEFRIYSGAESDLQVAVDAAAGPNNIVTDTGALVSLTVSLSDTNIDAHGLGLPVRVLANFENVSNVDVSTLPETTITSGDISVATIVNGSAVPQDVGSAKITATYGGKSGAANVNVIDSSDWPSLLHRYTFSDAQGTVVADSVGSINGTFNGTGTFNGSQLVMPAGNPAPVEGQPTAASGWVSFPAGQGMISGLPPQASIEVWVVWNGGGVWQEIYDFGQAATPGVSTGGGNYVMISPSDGTDNRLRSEWFPGGLLLQGPALTVGELSQVVLTHDETLQLDKLYRNGVLVASGVNPRLWASLPDTDNWLARDQWPDPMFNGAYDDFRIWNGALTSGQVANLYNAGPNVIAGPELKVSIDGNQITLRWPANATTFTLESTTEIDGTWTPVGTAATEINGVNTLTLSVSPSNTFYRLHQ